MSELSAKPSEATPPGFSPSSSSVPEGKPEIPHTLPILPVTDVVLFPGTIIPLRIGKPTSLRLIDDVLPETKILGIVTQRLKTEGEIGPEHLYEIGTAAMVLKLIRQSEDSAMLIVHGLQRFQLQKFEQLHPYLKADIRLLDSVPITEEDRESEAAVSNLRQSASELLSLTPDVPEQARGVIDNIPDPGDLADFLAVNLDADAADKQKILDQLDVRKRVDAVSQAIGGQLELARIQQKLRDDVQSQFTDAQRRAYLREQVKAIQKELGEDGDGSSQQVDELRQKLEETKPPEEVMEVADRELKRLEVIPPASPEFSIIVTYLETIAELPWNQASEDQLDLDRAQEILDRDHFDLEKVKRRIIEYLAVRKLNPEGRGPILCFLGPPGVGKTSLGQSIADALGREFVRMSLGGIRDEAEIRGHRRTYIGAMPGRIIQELRRAGSRNPVMMLDEIDKLGSDFRGDPASALLEVLDPRQNDKFSDRYLDVPFDLSDVLFIATANYVEGIPAPLRDRMETINIPGYTEAEKLGIAERYLVGRQLKENGLTAEQCQWKEAALKTVIEDYTREAGVRELERQIGAVCRGVGARVARDPSLKLTVEEPLIRELLGPPKYVREETLRTSQPGVVTGLAYTPVGGEILFIEAVRYDGKGSIQLTGQIGDVMRESAQAALSLVRSRADSLGITADLFKQSDVHIHVPAGAVPKDGPSAGVAMFTAVASLFLDQSVRSDVAMTGEISLRGLVLPIGGLKEKSLAALRAGIREIIIPSLNQKDLPDLPEEVRETITFHPVETVDEVLEIALES